MSISQYAPDGFHVGRVKALQPKLAADDLCTGVMQTEDPRIVSYLTNVLRLWSRTRNDLPHTFCDEVQITSVCRQPVVLAIADVQHERRYIKSIQEPHPNGSVDTNSWTTDDRFQMQAIGALHFSSTEAVETFDLPGRQAVYTCKGCSGEGNVACDNCAGTGLVLCLSCGGAERVVCPRCDGGGTHIGVSGRFVNCQICRTRGSVKCESCHRGHVQCSTCVHGQIVCATCQGCGQMRRRWVLECRTSSLANQTVRIHESWPIDFASASGEMDELAREEWVLPDEPLPALPFEGKLPRDVCVDARNSADAALSKEQVVNSEEHRITGLRVRVFAAYVYRLAFVFRDRPEEAFVFGLTNRVFTRRDAIRDPGVMKRILKLGSRLYDKAFVSGGVEIDRGYLDAVRNHRAHIADTRCLVPAASSLLASEATVTETGYRIDMPARMSPHENSTSINVDFDFDTGNRPILHIHFAIGSAQREDFPRVLEHNRHLSFGRIAVADVPNTGKQVFEFLDCRLYDYASPQNLAVILRTMAADVSTLYLNRVVNRL